MHHSPYQGPLFPSHCPPPPSGPPVLITRPAPGGEVSGDCLSNFVTGFNVHYRDRQSMPCCLNPLWCPGCKDRQPWKWYGYVVAVQQPSHKIILLEITAGAWTNAIRLKALNGQLRGFPLKVMRSRGSQRGKVSVHVGLQRVEYDLPREPHLGHVLARIWGIDQDLADVRPIQAADAEHDPTMRHTGGVRLSDPDPTEDVVPDDR